MTMLSLGQLEGMVEQEARDFVRFWSESHGTVLERVGSVGRVMEEVCREQIITKLFSVEGMQMKFSN